MSEYVMVPREPTEAMCDAARGIVMMDRFGLPSKSIPMTKVIQSGYYGELWGAVCDEDDLAQAHKLPKGHLASLIFRAMIASAPAPHGIGREAIARILRSLDHTPAKIYENVDNGFRRAGHLLDGNTLREIYAILALLPTEPPAQGEG